MSQMRLPRPAHAAEGDEAEHNNQQNHADDGQYRDHPRSLGPGGIRNGARHSGLASRPPYADDYHAMSTRSIAAAALALALACSHTSDNRVSTPSPSPTVGPVQVPSLMGFTPKAASKAVRAYGFRVRVKTVSTKFAPPPDLTAPIVCMDGWVSPSRGSGTCSWHGGEAPPKVYVWRSKVVGQSPPAGTLETPRTVVTIKVNEREIAHCAAIRCQP